MSLAQLPPPPEPGEASGLRAKQLKNQPIVLLPTGVGVGKGKDREGNPTEYEYINCTVWVLDRQGVTDSAEGVQFSWWRAREQLRDLIGQYVACRPVEQDDNSVILTELSGEALAVAAKVVESLKAEASGMGVPAPQDHSYDDETEAF